MHVLRSETNDSIVRKSLNIFTFSLLLEHFQIAPVAAASSFLFSLIVRYLTNGSKPPYLRIKSRVSLSSAHYFENKSKN